MRSCATATEHDNLRAALEWSLESAPQQGLRLANALVGFWEAHHHSEEGRRWLTMALERAAPWRRSSESALALEGAGALAATQAQYDAARACYTESLAIHRELGDRRGVAASLGGLGTVAYEQGDGRAGRFLLEESLAIERELGDPAGIAHALTELGQICRLEEYPLARALAEESLAICCALGDRHRVAESLMMLGVVMTAQQEYAAARTRLEEALAIRRELGDVGGAAVTLDRLADLARRQGEYAAGLRYVEECLTVWRAQGCYPGVIHALGLKGHLARGAGEYDQARAAYAESLNLRHQTQDSYAIITSLEDLAELAACEGQWERMVRLLGAALAQREAADKPLMPRGRASYDRLTAEAGRALDPSALATAWAEGRTLSLEQAVALALGQHPDSHLPAAARDDLILQ